MRCHLTALQDNLYYEAGRMLAIALVHGGPAPGFLSQTLFSCLISDSQHIQPVLEDVADRNILEAILTVSVRGNTIILPFVNYDCQNIANYLFVGGIARLYI